MSAFEMYLSSSLLSINGAKYKTKVIYATLNPVWNYTIPMYVYAAPIPTSATLIATGNLEFLKPRLTLKCGTRTLAAMTSSVNAL